MLPSPGHGTPGRTRSVGDRSGSWLRPRDRARLRARGRRSRRELQRERPRREGGRRRARATWPSRRGGAGRRRARGSGARDGRARAAHFGRLDILVNNAGIMARGPFLDVPVADYETMFAINVTGTFLCTQHALRPMVAARYGRIINFSTQLARASLGTGGFAAYAATTGAIEAFTRAMAHEFGPHGVTVNAIAPGHRHRHESCGDDPRVPGAADRRAAGTPPRASGGRRRALPHPPGAPAQWRLGDGLSGSARGVGNRGAVAPPTASAQLDSQ